MNWIRDNLRWLAVLVITLLATAAAITIWQQHSANDDLATQLKASNTQRDAMDSQLRTADKTIAGQQGQILSLVALNRQQGEDVAALLQRLDTITRNATARAVKLEAITHEDEAARTWGDTRLPDAVARLLDTTQTGGNPASPPDRDAVLRAGGGVPYPGQQPEDQPPAGAEPVGHARRP